MTMSVVAGTPLALGPYATALLIDNNAFEYMYWGRGEGVDETPEAIFREVQLVIKPLINACRERKTLNSSQDEKFYLSNELSRF